MRYSWFISILGLLFLAGCGSIKPAGLEKLPVVSDAVRPVSPFRFIGEGTLFRASIDIRKHHLTGLMLIKRMDTLVAGNSIADEGVYRVVFASEIGMTFFDLEIRSGELTVISCFESLNKKGLMKILRTDLSLLTTAAEFLPQKQYRQVPSGDVVFS